MPLEFPQDTDWYDLLQEDLASDYFRGIKDRYTQATQEDKTILPLSEDIFKAYKLSSFKDTKVVILGQDPYHRPGQATGLAFGVGDQVTIPPSLRNIYKELESDLGIEPPAQGQLERWAEQGVLLLNTSLTVESGQPLSHKKWGWENFTDATISILSSQKQHIVYMLWGRHAQSKRGLIDSTQNLILEAAHPSPLARNKYSGSAHFSQCNTYLKQTGSEPIRW